MCRIFLAITLVLPCLSLCAQEAAVEGLHLDVVVSDDTDGVLSEGALRESVIALLRTKLPEVVMDEKALLYLYVLPTCFRYSNGFSCVVDVSLIRQSQDDSPFDGSSRGLQARMVYWTDGYIFEGDPGDAPRALGEWLDQALDGPVAAWLSLDAAKRKCWRDYFNANTTFAPLSPC